MGMTERELALVMTVLQLLEQPTPWGEIRERFATALELVKQLPSDSGCAD
jgi:hypothetical protein